MADLLETDAIKRHTYQLWPYTRPLMLKLAAAQMLRLDIVREIPPVCLFVDDVITVHDQDDEGRFLARCVHEITESIILRGDYPVVLQVQDARIPHQIAEIVENRFLRAYRFHLEQVNDAHEQRQRVEGRKFPLPPEVYVVDEYCDAPFELVMGIARRRRWPRRQGLK